MKLAILTLTLLAAPALAAPFANGNTQAGKELHQKKCTACHIAKYSGDGSKIYTRAERRVKTASSLAQQITTCNNALGNELFPEEEAHLGAYLNGQFYKFK
ncbi:MAG: cytochrome c [Betaproteobacteria bacterium]|nr:cytochrome c [Betaproteobacteria bacterium]